TRCAARGDGVGLDAQETGVRHGDAEHVATAREPRHVRAPPDELAAMHEDRLEHAIAVGQAAIAGVERVDALLAGVDVGGHDRAPPVKLQCWRGLQSMLALLPTGDTSAGLPMCTAKPPEG